MSELKACPFCGKPPAVSYNGYPHCPIPGVGAHAGGMKKEEWNTRPIEDALQARIEELDSEVSEEYMLRVMWEERHDTLRQSISDAVGEMKTIAATVTLDNKIARSYGVSDNKLKPFVEGVEKALDILRKHRLAM